MASSPTRSPLRKTAAISLLVVAALLVCWPQTTAQIVNTALPTFQAPTTSTLASNIALAANTIQNVLVVTPTIPSSGGPFRISTNYWVYWNSPSTAGMACNGWVTDGTNNWAASQIEDPVNNGHSGNNGSGISTVNYANSATPTITLKVDCNQAGTVQTTPFVGGSPNTSLQVQVFASP